MGTYNCRSLSKGLVDNLINEAIKLNINIIALTEVRQKHKVIETNDLKNCLLMHSESLNGNAGVGFLILAEKYKLHEWALFPGMGFIRLSFEGSRTK
uniref:Endo/exonuclease/phosphatase domain-containing protein n=1 Tax=Strongyloides papillosus TaxID=174720 RepID=A0A0N5CIS3_STREA